MGTEYLKELYHQDEIDSQFNATKLFDFLRQDNILPIGCKKMFFHRNDYLISKGERSEYVYYIEDGLVSMEGNDRVIDFKSASDIVGFQELMMFEKTEFSYKALSKGVIVWKFKKIEVLDKLLNTQEGYLYHYHYLTQELQSLQQKEIFLRKASAEKLEQSLIYLIKKFGTKSKTVYSTKFVELPITVVSLAQYIEVHHATIYRKIREMKKHNIVYTEKQKIYVNLEALKNHERR